MRPIHEMRARQSHNQQLERITDLHRDLLQVLWSASDHYQCDGSTGLMFHWLNNLRPSNL